MGRTHVGVCVPPPPPPPSQTEKFRSLISSCTEWQVGDPAWPWRLLTFCGSDLVGNESRCLQTRRGALPSETVSPSMEHFHLTTDFQRSLHRLCNVESYSDCEWQSGNDVELVVVYFNVILFLQYFPALMYLFIVDLFKVLKPQIYPNINIE
jgi:hypothetical protein